MDTIRKFLVILCMGALGWLGILFIVKASRPPRRTNIFEKALKDIDERLKESKAALEEATAHLQSVFGHIKNRNM